MSFFVWLLSGDKHLSRDKKESNKISLLVKIEMIPSEYEIYFFIKFVANSGNN